MSRRPCRIAVVGMGRSGTTLLMELLSDAGVFVGDVNWALEHEEARLINDSYLEQNFGARLGLPYGNLPAEEIEVNERAWTERSAMFAAAMDERAGDNPIWAFKDPRTTILSSLWRDSIDVFVGVFRSPGAVIDSYLSQGWIDGFRKRRTVARYWERFNRSLVDLSGDSTTTTYIAEMASDFPAQFGEISSKLGVSLDEGVVRDKFDARKQPPPGLNGVRSRHRELYASLLACRTVPL